MSSIVVSATPLRALDLLATAGIRPPETITGTPPTFTWTPDLSASDQTTAQDIATMTNFGVTLSLAEWQSIKADAASLKAFLGIASPTNAQSIAAIKSIIRVLGTIVRN